MTIVHANETNFSERLASLREEIFSRDFSQAINCSSADSALCAYFHYYGFDDSAIKASAGYSLGVIKHKSWRLVAHWWKREHSRGTVFVAHGLFDHVGIYLKLIAFLLDDGYNVFAVDMPGHGLSEGPSAEIDNFSEYVEVLESCVETVTSESQKSDDDKSTQTLIMLGQSTGGAAVAHYLMTGKQRARIARAVLLAPLLRPKGWWSVNISWLLLHNFIRQVPRRFAVNSNDQQFLDFLANRDPLQPQYISIRWLTAMRRWIYNFPKFQRCDTPMLIVQGDDDNTVDWKYNTGMFQSRFPQSKLVVLQGAKHHLVNESAIYKHKVHKVIAEFLG